MRNVLFLSGDNQSFDQVFETSMLKHVIYSTVIKGSTVHQGQCCAVCAAQCEDVLRQQLDRFASPCAGNTINSVKYRAIWIQKM